MAISTYKIFLMQKNTSAWEKLIDIKEFPDLGGAPEMLETTTLSDKMQTYIPGIQSLDSLGVHCELHSRGVQEAESTGRYGEGVRRLVRWYGSWRYRHSLLVTAVSSSSKALCLFMLTAAARMRLSK